LTLAVCVALAAVSASAGSTPSAAPTRTPPLSAAGLYVVVPPAGPAEPELAWIGEAVADALPRALERAGLHAVDRADRLRAQDALGVPHGPVSRATSIRVAEALGAYRLVVGSYEAPGGTLRLSLRLLDVERGQLSAPVVAGGPIERLLNVIHAAAFDIAVAAQAPPSTPRADLEAMGSSIPFEAFRAYAQSLSLSDMGARGTLLQRALMIHPAYEDARLALGRMQIETHDWTTARETLGRITAGSSLTRVVRFLDGVALLGLGRHADAAAAFAALAREDASAAVLNNQAVAYLRLGGKETRASSIFRQALEKAPDSSDIAFNLAWSLLVEGDADAARFWASGVVQHEPKDAAARLVVTWALRKQGRDADADEEWKALLADAPAYADSAAPDLGRRLERVQSSERAIVLAGDDTNDAELAAGHLGRAERLVAAGDAQGALPELSRATTLNPYAPRAHLLLARVHKSLGDRERALDELQMSLWCREDAEVRLEKAGLLRDLGRGAEARSDALRVLQADPANADARRLLDQL
jgi:tetratricopeptide (TPR) repeat protein